jgi:hypothetical protein
MLTKTNDGEECSTPVELAQIQARFFSRRDCEATYAAKDSLMRREPLLRSARQGPPTGGRRTVVEPNPARCGWKSANGLQQPPGRRAVFLFALLMHFSKGVHQMSKFSEEVRLKCLPALHTGDFHTVLGLAWGTCPENILFWTARQASSQRLTTLRTSRSSKVTTFSQRIATLSRFARTETALICQAG